MKAAVVEKAGVLVVRDVPMPEMGEYDALCETLYGATCSGTDLHIISGHNNWNIKFPSVLGHESVGRVLKIGSKVKNIKVGDVMISVNLRPVPGAQVGTCFGGFAEYTLAFDWKEMRKAGIDFHHRIERTRVLPPGFDPRAATMLVTWRETLSYLTRMGESHGKNVLILGSGGTGLAFVSHLKNLGAAGIVVSGSASREAIARQIGCTRYFDYKTGAIKNSGETFDMIIDSVGKVGEIDKVLALLKVGGTIGIYGMDDDGKVTVNPSNAKGTFTIYNSGYHDGEKHDEIVQLMLQGKLNASLFMNLENPYPLEKIADAYKAVETKKEIKALVKIHA